MYKKMKEILYTLTYSINMKKIYVIMLACQCILLKVVNRTRAIIYSVILHNKSICFFA